MLIYLTFIFVFVLVIVSLNIYRASTGSHQNLQILSMKGTYCIRTGLDFPTFTRSSLWIWLGKFLTQDHTNSNLTLFLFSMASYCYFLLPFSVTTFYIFSVPYVYNDQYFTREQKITVQISEREQTQQDGLESRP